MKKYVLGLSFFWCFLFAAVSDSDYRYERSGYFNQNSFYIEEIEREDAKIEIKFNIPADPSLLKPSVFLIDGKPLPDSLRIRFSRKCDEVEIYELPEWRGRVIGIQVVGLYSTAGLKIEDIPPIYMYDDEEYERENDLDYVYWYWYDTHGGVPYEGGPDGTRIGRR